MLKNLQARLQQYMNWELPDVQAGFRKGRGTRDQIVNIHWIIKKQKSSRKTSTSASLTTIKPLTVWITTNWKILQEMGIPDHLIGLLRSEVKSLSHVRLFVTPWTVAYQAPWSMGFSRQGYWRPVCNSRSNS